MKKAFPVNINGKIFYIDEDAYTLLRNYLDQLHQAFADSEGEEIVSDIESRISELFDERIAAGAKVIVFADVNNVIEIMGKPSEISAGDDDCEPSEAAGEQTGTTGQTNAPVEEVEIKKRLFRSAHKKVFGGVIGGLSIYLGWDATIMRIAFAALAVVTHVWPLFILYLILWMVIPVADTPRRILEQQGYPVTVDNIGQSVLSSTPPPYPGTGNNSVSELFSTAFSLIGKFCMAMLGLIGSVGVLVATGFFIFFIVALIACVSFGDLTLIDHFDSNLAEYAGSFIPIFGSIAFISLSLCFIIPAIALTWISASVLFNCKVMSKSTAIVSLILETIFIVATIIMFIFLDKWI